MLPTADPLRTAPVPGSSPPMRDVHPGNEDPAALRRVSADRFHIPSLDGIRAVSFLFVFASHAGLRDMIPGGFGVTVFFFLSGYLISTLLCREAQQTGRIDLGKFYLRRVYRIFPPMYIVLATSLALTFLGIFHNQLQFPRVIAQVFHLTNYYMVFSDGAGMAKGTGIFWSLAIEEHFYLFFPLLLIFLRTRFALRGQISVLLGICGAVLVWRCVVMSYFSFGPAWTYYCTDARIDSILFGCVLGISQGRIPDTEKSRFIISSIFLPLGIAILLFTFIWRNEIFRDTARYTLQGIALAPVFLSAIRSSDSPAFRWLNWSWLTSLGVLSYTLYLIHPVALIFCHEYARFPGLLSAAAALLVSIVYAAVIHRFVERPFAKLRRKLHPE
jgi:peptidoglycan/LPS O-acetylase OafA/YrhL